VFWGGFGPEAGWKAFFNPFPVIEYQI